MKALDPIHRIVAREVALGFCIEAICEARNLDLGSWKRVSKSSIFQEEVKRMADKFEEQEVENYHENPAIQKLKAAQLKAVTVLTEEMDNYDKEVGGATASTRIKAANSILEKSGIVQTDKEVAPITIIQISAAKEVLLQRPQELPIMPDSVSATPGFLNRGKLVLN